MQPEDRDAAFQTASELVRGIRYEDFLHDRKLQLAVERAVEIIGEAARRVSDARRAAHPEIPWKSIIGMRNVLAHEYGEVKQDRMWLLVTERIPELIANLTRIVPPDPPEAP